jgi:hypothetical protein
MEQLFASLLSSVFPLFVIGFIFFVIVGLVPKKRRAKKSGVAGDLKWPALEQPPKYEKQTHLLTPAERSFMGALKLALQGEVLIMAQVGLQGIIDVKKGLTPGERQTALNKIQRKRIDFVICDPDDYSIYCAIELDDKSHSQKNRVERDQFLERALSGAGVVLHRFPAQRTYSIPEIRQKLLGFRDHPSQEPKVPPLSKDLDDTYYEKCEVKVCPQS